MIKKLSLVAVVACSAFLLGRFSLHKSYDIYLEEQESVSVVFGDSLFTMVLDGDASEAGVIINGDLKLALSISSDGIISNIRTMNYLDHGTSFIIDIDGNGIPDLKKFISYDNPDIVTTYLKFESINNGQD